MTSRTLLRASAFLAAVLLAMPIASAEPLGPSAPTNLTAAATAPGEVALAWDAASSIAGVSAYRIYQVDADGLLALAAEVPGDQLNWTATGLPPGMSVTYAVSAVDLVGEGPTSEPASATTWSVPDAPTDVAVTSGPGAVGETQVTWAAPADDGGSPVLAYNVYRDGELVATVDAATLQWVDAGLTPLHAYTYHVSALNEVGEGAASTEACGMASPWTGELGCQSLL